VEFRALRAVCAGAVLIPLYPTSSVEEVRHILRHSDAKVAVVEATEHLGKVRAIRGDLPALDEVVVIDPDGDSTGAALTLDELARHGRRQPGPLRRRLAEIEPTDLASILYTSGTTGPPKGCMLDHAAWLATVTMTTRALPLRRGERGYLSPASPGCSRSSSRVQPGEAGAVLLGTAHWAAGPRHRPTAAGPAGQGRLAVADRLVLARVRGVLGGQIKQCITGAAPIAPEILEFFWAIGVPVLESYGMTESPVIALNRPDHVRIGSVGKPLPGMRVMIADDGEILLQGPNLLRGYYRDEAATAATIRDGWLHTGDLGRLDEDGFLSITGRKKELIITATGKNVAPIESRTPCASSGASSKPWSAVTAGRTCPRWSRSTPRRSHIPARTRRRWSSGRSTRSTPACPAPCRSSASRSCRASCPRRLAS
jgi:long-chain acyl-CoA synthetase